MTTAYIFTFVVILLLIILSGFFSGSETALTAASRARMHQLEKNGDKRAGQVTELIENREQLIGTLLIGNNIVNILASALATSFFLGLFGEAGVAIATLVMTVLVVIFAEVMPKSIALDNADKFAVTVAPIIRVIVKIFAPLAKTVGWLVRKILKLVGVSIGNDDLLTAHEELRGAVEMLHRDGSVIKDDRDRLGGILDFQLMQI